MKKKLWLILCLILVVVLATVGCSAPAEEVIKEEAMEETVMEKEVVAEEDMVESQSENELLELTYDELAKYNGEDSMPAYVAVDGVIYDVTDVPAWKGGKHKGNVAGQDVTDAIKNKSPHGVKNLEGLTIVGKIKQ